MITFLAEGDFPTGDRFRAGLVSMIQQLNDAGARVILCTPTVIGEKHDDSNRMDEMLEQLAGISRNVAEELGLSYSISEQLFLLFD